MSTNNFFIKGLAITTPILGRISIGHREVNKSNKVVPVRDDQIFITSQVRDGLDWTAHPIETDLKSALPAPQGTDAANAKLRSIPITLMYNNPELNMQANYSAFDNQTGRPMCIGDGVKAKRFSLHDNKTNEVECVGPQHCEFAQNNRCRLNARLNVQIDNQDDPLGSFIFRTSGYNSVRTLIYKLHGFSSLFKGKLRGVKFNLVIRAKSTVQSMGKPIYYLDLVLRAKDLVEAMKEAQAQTHSEAEAGLDQAAFEEVMLQGLRNSSFLETDEDGLDIVEEFSGAGDDTDGQTLNLKTGQTTGGLASLAKVLPDNQVNIELVQKDELGKAGDQASGETAPTIESEINAMSLSSFRLPPEIAAQFDSNTPAQTA